MGKHPTEVLNTAHEYFILKVTCIGSTSRQTFALSCFKKGEYILAEVWFCTRKIA